MDCRTNSDSQRIDSGNSAVTKIIRAGKECTGEEQEMHAAQDIELAINRLDWELGTDRCSRPSCRTQPSSPAGPAAQCRSGIAAEGSTTHPLERPASCSLAALPPSLSSIHSLACSASLCVPLYFSVTVCLAVPRSLSLYTSRCLTTARYVSLYTSALLSASLCLAICPSISFCLTRRLAVPLPGLLYRLPPT